MKKQLPTGTQSFQEFTDDNLYYVDKTEHIFKIVSTKKCYFLARRKIFRKTSSNKHHQKFIRRKI